MRPGEATFAQTGEDQVTLSWEAEDGALVELPMSLRDAANLQAGQPVSSYGPSCRFSLADRRAALEARNDQIHVRLGELEDAHPQLRRDPQEGN